MNSIRFSPVLDQDCIKEDIENQDITKPDNALINTKPIKKSLPPPLLPIGQSRNNSQHSILKASSKDNIFKSPPPSSRSLKVNVLKYFKF